METLYDVLGVAPDADRDTIRRAYRERAKRHHPDAAGGDAMAFRRITTARDVLLDEVRRERYDALGHRRYAARHLDDEEWPVDAPSRTAEPGRRSRSRRRGETGPRSRGRRTRQRRRPNGGRRKRRERSSGPADAAVALRTYRAVLVRAGLLLLMLLVLAAVLSALSL